MVECAQPIALVGVRETIVAERLGRVLFIAIIILANPRGCRNRAIGGAFDTNRRLQAETGTAAAYLGDLRLGQSDPLRKVRLREAVMVEVRLERGHARQHALGALSGQARNMRNTPWRSRKPRFKTMGMKRLKIIREARGLTQRQLAEMVGADQSQISKIERGDEAVSLGRIYAIAAALNVGPGELFDPSELQDRIMRLVYSLREEQRDSALRILEALVGQQTPPGNKP
jgi:transcriptional regulator with XRE-family HTH domain